MGKIGKMWFPLKWLWKSFFQPTMELSAYATSIALQINCKLGGIPWLVNLEYEDLMVIGIDVSICREKRVLEPKRFSAAFALLNPMQCVEVAGDEQRAYYFKSIKYSTGNSIGDAVLYFTDSLKEYAKYFKKRPKKIVIYRDGINDGDIPMTLESEVEAIKNAIAYTDRNWDPEFAFILVNKNCRARFFKEVDKQISNPETGTIVDSVVTLPGRFDFYLISQKQEESKTVVPVYYNVIHDDFCRDDPNKVQKIQNLTFKLTHNYFNWTGGVRVPSVCQYAKKLARMSALHVGNLDALEIENKHRLCFL